MEELINIDLKDRKIIYELDRNARIQLNELSKKVRLSRQVVQYRIEKLEKNGVLSFCVGIFDSAVVGQNWFRVILQFQKITKEQKENFIKHISNHSNIIWAGEVGGNWDFVINFVTKDQFEFNRLLEQLLKQWGIFIQRYEILTYISLRDQSRNYLLSKEDPKYWYHEMHFNPKIKFDGIDKKIIEILSKNGKLSASRIGIQTNVNYKTIQNHIKELENKKVIIGYRYFINCTNIGYEAHMLFINIQIYKPELEKQLYEFLKHPNVTFVVKHLGRWRVGMEIEVRNRNEFQNFLIELRTRFGEIISEYETFPIFKDHVLNYFPLGALYTTNQQ